MRPLPDDIARLLVEGGLARSRSQARRKYAQGAYSDAEIQALVVEDIQRACPVCHLLGGAHDQPGCPK